MHEEIRQMKQDYEARIEALEKRLQAAEASPAAAPVAPVATTAAPSAAMPPNATAPTRSIRTYPSFSTARTRTCRKIQHVPLAGVRAGRRRGRVGQARPQSWRIGIDAVGEHRSAILRTVNVLPGTGQYGQRRGGLFPDVGAGQRHHPEGRPLFLRIGYLNSSTRTPGISTMRRWRTRRSSAGSTADDGVQLKWLAPTDLFCRARRRARQRDRLSGQRPQQQRHRRRSRCSRMPAATSATTHSWRAGLSYLQTRARDRQL